MVAQQARARQDLSREVGVGGVYAAVDDGHGHAAATADLPDLLRLEVRGVQGPFAVTDGRFSLRCWRSDGCEEGGEERYGGAPDGRGRHQGSCGSLLAIPAVRPV